MIETICDACGEKIKGEPSRFTDSRHRSMTHSGSKTIIRMPVGLDLCPCCSERVSTVLNEIQESRKSKL